MLRVARDGEESWSSAVVTPLPAAAQPAGVPEDGCSEVPHEVLLAFARSREAELLQFWRSQAPQHHSPSVRERAREIESRTPTPAPAPTQKRQRGPATPPETTPGVDALPCEQLTEGPAPPTHPNDLAAPATGSPSARSPPGKRLRTEDLAPPSSADMTPDTGDVTESGHNPSETPLLRGKKRGKKKKKMSLAAQEAAARNVSTTSQGRGGRRELRQER